MEVVVEKLC